MICDLFSSRFCKSVKKAEVIPLKMGKSAINIKKKHNLFCRFAKTRYLCTRKTKGAIAQLVEQRTENPCVPGSIPGGTTAKKSKTM